MVGALGRARKISVPPSSHLIATIPRAVTLPAVAPPASLPSASSLVVGGQWFEGPGRVGHACTLCHHVA
eukprot:7625768-Pyramimonas_sp.AAC.1